MTPNLTDLLTEEEKDIIQYAQDIEVIFGNIAKAINPSLTSSDILIWCPFVEE